MPRLSTKEWLRRYQAYWWSPEPGPTYTCEGIGPGNLANACPGAFNLAWALLQPRRDYAFIEAATKQQATHRWLMLFCLCEVQGYPLGEWAVVYNMKEFNNWLKTHAEEVIGLEWLRLNHTNPREAVHQIISCTTPKAAVK